MGPEVTAKQKLSLAEFLEQNGSRVMEREGDLHTGEIPLILIDNKDVAVNHENLDIVARQLTLEAEAKGTTGQEQPILLGRVEGLDLLQIIDGFHRFDIFSRRDIPTIFSTVIDVTAEELIDKRIANTSNHSGLQFSRAVQWINEAWDLNPYKKRINASSAFVLGRMKSSNGKRLGLSQEEVDEIKAWVDNKADLWGLAPLTIYAYLNTAKNVATELVDNSRPSGEQAKRSAISLPTSSLASIGRQLPGRHELHLVLAAAFNAHKLGSSGQSSLIRDIKNLSDVDAIDYIENMDASAYKEKLAQAPSWRFKEADLVRLTEVRQTSRVRPLEEIVKATMEAVTDVLDEGEYDVDRMLVVARELGALSIRLRDFTKEVVHRIDSKDKLSEIQHHIRPVEEFNTALSSFLMNPGEEFVITTEKERRACERAVNRGRGNPQSIDRLREIISEYK